MAQKPLSSAQVDTDRSGTVELDEFEHMVRETLVAPRPRRLPPAPLRTMAACSLRFELGARARDGAPRAERRAGGPRARRDAPSARVRRAAADCAAGQGMNPDQCFCRSCNSQKKDDAAKREDEEKEEARKALEAAKLEEDSKNPPKGGKAPGRTGSAVGRTGSAVGRTGSAVGRTGSTVGRTGSVAKPGS